MADEKIRYVLDVDDKGTPKIVKFGQASEKSGKQAEKAFDKASKSVQDFGQEIPVVGRAMSALASPAAAAGAAMAAVGVGLGAAAKKNIDFADGINDLSLRLGISTERLSVLSLYAEQSGTDIESVASAMGKLGVKLSEGDKALAKYGITATSVDGALYQVADRIAATEDPMLRLKIATDAFGKSGQQMLPMLVQGGDALRGMADSAPVVSSEMARMSDQFNDSLADLKGSFQAIGLDLANAFLPSLQKAADLAKEIATSLRGGRAKDLQGLAMEEAKVAELQAKLADPSLGAWQRTRLKGQLRNAEAGVALRRQGMLSESVGAMSGPGGMGGYRGELPPSVAAGVIGAGSTAKAGPAAQAQFADAGEDPNWSFRRNQFRAAQFEAAKMAAGDTGTEAQFQAGRIGAVEGAKGESVDLEQIDYYAGLPISEKAKESIRKKEDEAIKEEQDAYNRRIEIFSSVAGKSADIMVASGMAGFQAFDNMFARMAQRNAEMSDSWTKTFEGIGLAFSSMLVKMVEEMAVKSAIFGAFSLFGGGGLLGGGSLTKFLGFASGGTPPAGVPSIVGERRAEAIIPQGPSRVSPVAGSGMVVNITVSNPAEARSVARQLQKDGRTRSRGIR